MIIDKALSKIFGTKHERDIKAMRPRVNALGCNTVIRIDFWKEHTVKYRARFLGKAMLVLGAIAVLGGIVMMLWNAVVPFLFPGARLIDDLHALGLLILTRILFGGFRGRGGWHGVHRRAAHRERVCWRRPAVVPERREVWINIQQIAGDEATPARRIADQVVAEADHCAGHVVGPVCGVPRDDRALECDQRRSERAGVP